jgi:SAM-dependent methyltransferase
MDSYLQSDHARVYDRRMAESERGDVAYYRERATAANGPVLEVACGTGRIYLELLAAGVDADGIDVTEPALSVLREKAAERGLDPSIRQADMESFSVDRTYDLVICPFNALQHAATIDDLLAVLSSAHDALAPGGEFVFDVFVPSFDVICEEYGEWTTEEVTYEGKRHEFRERATVVDEVEQRIQVENELRDPEGETVFSVDHRLSMLPKRTVELLARQSPFAEWRVTGGFTDEPLTDGDTVQVWTLQR